jgi:hypothetical protein
VQFRPVDRLVSNVKDANVANPLDILAMLRMAQLALGQRVAEVVASRSPTRV